MKKVLVFLCATAMLLGMSQMANAVVIDFDDLTAPFIFSSQDPLAEEYAALGVHFSGTGEVLNGTSGWPWIDAGSWSAPNFLAFNESIGAYPPETISFDFLVDAFSVDFVGYDFAADDSDTVFISAYLDDSLIETFSFSTPRWTSGHAPYPMETLEVDGIVFNSVIISVAESVGGVMAMDNLTFNPFSQPIPEPNTILLLASGLIGLAGVRRKFKK